MAKNKARSTASKKKAAKSKARSTASKKKVAKSKARSTASKKKVAKSKARSTASKKKAAKGTSSAVMRTAATDRTGDPFSEILAALDDNVRRSNWVDFENYMGGLEYHAMRLIGARERTGPGWVVMLETVAGDYLSEYPEVVEAACIRGTLCGGNLGEPPAWWPLGPRRPLGITIDSRPKRRTSSLDGLAVNGPCGVLHTSDAMLLDLDLRPGRYCGLLPGGAVDPTFVLALRAYLTVYPGAFWGDPLESLAPLGFADAIDVIVVSDAFEHVVGPQRRKNPALKTYAIMPSESRTFRSLAQCMAARDASLFEPGEPNLEWRRWAVFDDEGLTPRSAKRAAARTKR